MTELSAREPAKVLVVFGTRPEAIKLAPVIMELESHPASFRTLVCATGQHQEMLDDVLRVFRLRPHENLRVMRPGQTLTQVTTATLEGLERVLTRERPHLMLVQGDSTTAMTAALAAYYHRVPVGHVEAGLRTNDKYRPFPEEINRRLATSLADFHFAPTDASRENLLREGIREKDVAVTGNTVIDALVHIRARLLEDPGLALDPLGSGETRKIIVVTAHRRESFGEQFRQMCEAIRAVAERRPDVLIVYPVHLNPNVQGPVHEILQGVCNVRLVPPMNYASFVALMVRAHILLTDSGGLQEEGPALGKPVLVMRETSERPEGMAAGASVLVGTTPDRIVGAVLSLLDDSERYHAMASGTHPYGDGRAAERIVQFLRDRRLA